MKKVLCELYIDESKVTDDAVEAVENAIDAVSYMGLTLGKARLLDEDEECDETACDLAEKIFNEEEHLVGEEDFCRDDDDDFDDRRKCPWEQY